MTLRSKLIRAKLIGWKLVNPEMTEEEVLRIWDGLDRRKVVRLWPKKAARFASPRAQYH